jgi:hypothetical protein
MTAPAEGTRVTGLSTFLGRRITGTYARDGGADFIDDGTGTRYLVTEVTPDEPAPAHETDPLTAYLIAAGFEPDDTGEDCEDIWSGTGTVRVAWLGARVSLEMLDAGMGLTWQAIFSPATPRPVIIAAVHAARAAIAADAGRPSAVPATPAEVLAEDARR